MCFWVPCVNGLICSVVDTFKNKPDISFVRYKLYIYIVGVKISEKITLKYVHLTRSQSHLKSKHPVIFYIIFFSSYPTKMYVPVYISYRPMVISRANKNNAHASMIPQNILAVCCMSLPLVVIHVLWQFQDPVDTSGRLKEQGRLVPRGRNPAIVNNNNKSCSKCSFV